MTEKVELTVVNPRGEIESQPTFAPSPRLSSLDGKRIGLYSNSKQGMDNVYAVVEELIKRDYPTVSVVRAEGAFEIRDDEAENFAQQVDAFIYAVGD